MDRDDLLEDIRKTIITGRVNLHYHRSIAEHNRKVDSTRSPRSDALNLV